MNMTRQGGKEREVFSEASFLLGPKLGVLHAFFFFIEFSQHYGRVL